MIGVRVDVDTVRDAKMLPHTLELLREREIRASFFVTTGVDETYRNYKNYLNPARLLFSGAIQRYGMDIFTGLLSKMAVQDTPEIGLILDEGHELGLHGVDHFWWMNNLGGVGREEISSQISRGSDLFEGAFGFQPRCFAAPGFKTSADFLSALDDFDFKYSSDFIGHEFFYPSNNGTTFKTMQMPVSLDLERHDEGEARDKLKNQMASGYSVFYFHPSSEPVFRRELLEEALDLVSGSAKPLGEMV
jgi:undecaprenyl phosphate-alpha-L-ara4FN deformylase